MIGPHLAQELALEAVDVADLDAVEIAAHAGEDGDHLLLHRHRRELVLLEKLGQPRAAIEEALRRRVEVGAELCEGRHLAVLGELQLDPARHLPHRLHLGGRADPAHRETDINRRPDALVEEIGLEEDLPVGDGDDVGRDVGRDVVGLGLDHRHRGERARAVVLVHLGRALEQARVQIEHVAGIGLAPRRAAQQQRHLAVGHGLLGEVVVEDDRVHPVVAEILADGAAGIGGEELQRRGLGGRRRDDDGVVERAVLLQGLDDLRHGRAFLAHRDIDAVELARFVVAGVDLLLVDDGVDGDGGLAGLAVADDELALAAADGHQRVERLEAGLHRLVHRAARDDAGGLDLDPAALGALDRALAVERVAERVHDAPQQPLAHRHVDDGAGALDDVAFLDVAVFAEDHDADIVGLEIERHAPDAAGEFHHLAGLDVVEPVDPGHAVADGEHLAHLGDIGLGAEIGDLLLQDCRNFGGADIHLRSPSSPIRDSATWSEASCRACASRRAP